MHTSAGPIVTLMLYLLHSGASQSTQCFMERLTKCKLDLNRIIGDVPSDYSRSGSGNHHHFNLDIDHLCNDMRRSLDCHQSYSGTCIQNAPYLNQDDKATGSIQNDINRSKMFLDKYCDQLGGFQVNSCYNRPDLQQCESSLTGYSSMSSCINYNTFRSCAVNFVRNNCNEQDLMYFPSYVLAKGSDQSWKCPIVSDAPFLERFGPVDRESSHASHVPEYHPNSNYHRSQSSNNPQERQGYGDSMIGPNNLGSNYNNGRHPPHSFSSSSSSFNNNPMGPNGYNNQGSGGYGSSSGYGYTNPDLHNHQMDINDPRYTSSSSGSFNGYNNQNNNQYGSSAGSGFYGMQNPNLPNGNNMYGGSSLDSSLMGLGGAGGDMTNRQFGGGIYPGEMCVERATKLAAPCEDMLMQRQRDTRNARTGPDVQRRICCSLFFYTDCLAKVVMTYCRDGSPSMVNLLMGNKRRETAITCRDISREQCNSSHSIKTSITLLSMSMFLVLFLSYLL